MDGITLITCTGGRPEAFQLCLTYVMRQTWEGWFQWILINDVNPDLYETLSEQSGHALVTRLFPAPKWQPGQNTMARNLLAAIPEVRYDKVLFAEDDDWYAPDYVEAMAQALDHADIVGEPGTRYYNVAHRMHMTNPKRRHASLCATGIRKELLPILQRLCEQDAKYLDAALWQQTANMRQMLIDSTRVVGIKGMPGRPGVGMGHRPQLHSGLWNSDPNMKVLPQWIGADAEWYRGYKPA